MSRDEQWLAQVEALMQTLSTASAIFDRELRFLAANTLWRDVYGLGDAPLAGRSLYDADSPRSDEYRAIHARCLAGGTVRRDASAVAREDGTVDYIDLVAAPWRDTDGSIVGIAVHTEVVTDHVRMRRRLVEEQAFVHALVEKSPIGFNLCRFDGLWLESNPAFLDIIGYTAEEADGGLTYWELTPPEYAEQEQEQLASLESNGRYGPYEKEFIRKDGSRVPVRLNGFTIERGGEKYIWSLIEDITSERALEANAERQRLAAIHAAKLASIGEMAAGIAHEINNPLQIVDGFAYELQQSLASGETPPADAVDMIRHATARAARIVRGLRRFARDDDSDVGAHAIAELVQEAMNLTATRIRNHGVRLDVEIRSSRVVRCSSLEMTQVLVNLLNNAFDAVRADEGWVRLEVSDEDDNRVAFRVTDSGTAIPEDQRERIFEPFVTSKPPGEGTGLGLSVSRGIVEAVDGTLTCESLDGHSSFVVRLVVGST